MSLTMALPKQPANVIVLTLALLTLNQGSNPGITGPKKGISRKTLSLLLVILFEGAISSILLILLVGELIGFSWARTVLFEDCLPNDGLLNPGGSYCLSVVRNDLFLSHENLIVVGRGPSPTYGFTVKYPTYSVPTNLGDPDKPNPVEWGEDMVKFTDPLTKLEISIPNEMYLNGR